MDSSGIEEHLLSNLKAYIGKSDKELKDCFGIDKTNNKNTWVELAYRMLGIPSNNAKELIDSKITVKTIRINKEGKIKENMSFPTIVFKKLVKESWEESFVYKCFSTTNFLFIVYKEIESGYVFLGGTFWSMPDTDLNGFVFKEWNDIKAIVSKGVTFSEKNGIVTNSLPKKSQTRVIHLRPKADRAAYRLNIGIHIGDIKKDADQLPNGEWMTKQCFWLNNDYVLAQIENDSVLVKCSNSLKVLDNQFCDLLKLNLTREFYLIEDFRNIMKRILKSDDDIYMNSRNLNKLGFKFWYTYVLSSKYESVIHYIGSLLMKDEIVDLNRLEPKLKEINNFDEIILQIVCNYPVYRINEGVFVRTTKLVKGGISENDIKNFIKMIHSKYCSGYFTVTLLRKHAVLEEIFSHGFNDCFYEDMILSSKVLKSFSINGIRVFCGVSMKDSLNGLFEHVLADKRKMDIFDLNVFLDSSYGIRIDVKRLKNILRFSELYYNRDTEKVYFNRQLFIEEIC